MVNGRPPTIARAGPTASPRQAWFDGQSRIATIAMAPTESSTATAVSPGTNGEDSST